MRFYNHFTYENGGNPYISFTDDNLFLMICKYRLTQEFETGFHVWEERKPRRKTYTRIKEILRDFAIQWQSDFEGFNYTQSELITWAAFFEKFGKKYGLLREFRENGII